MINRIGLSLLIFALTAFIAKGQNLQPLNAFHSVTVIGKIDLELILSDSEALDINIKGVEKDDVTYEVSDSIFKLKLLSAAYDDARITAKLYFKNIGKIESSSGALVNSAHIFTQNELVLNAIAGGEIYLKLNTNNLVSASSSGSVVFCEGSTTKQSVDVGSGASFSGYDLESDTAMVKATAGGIAKVNVIKFLEAKASLGGNISYKGNPSRTDKKETLGGTISRY